MRKLRGRIVEKYGTIGNFAIALHVSRQNVSILLNRGTFNSKTIKEWAVALDIPLSEIGEYFFA